MEEYRSKPHSDGKMEMEVYYGTPNNTNPAYGMPTYITSSSIHNHNNANNFQDLRCYSASHAENSNEVVGPRELNRGKSVNASSKVAWCFGDPEMQRKKRVASYKAYGVEGKIKRSFSKSFRWLKGRCTNMVHGW